MYINNSFPATLSVTSFMRVNGPVSSLTSSKPVITCLGKTSNCWLLPSETRRLQVSFAAFNSLLFLPCCRRTKQSGGYTIRVCIHIEPSMQGGTKPTSL